MNGNPDKLDLQITPTKGVSNDSISASTLTSGFRNTVSLGIEKLNAENPEQATGLFLYSKGVKSEKLVEKVNASGLLTLPEKESFLRSAETIKTLEEVYPQRSSLLFSAFREPEIQITEPVLVPPPTVQQIAFVRQEAAPPILSSENFSLGPIGSYAKQIVGGFAHKQLKKVVNKAAKKVAEKAAKKIAEGVVKTGAKVAAKGTLSLAAQAIGSVAPIIGNIIAWLLTEVVFAALSLISKFVNWVKKHKEDALAILVGAGFLFGQPLLVGAGLFGLALGGIPALGIALSSALSFLSFLLTAMILPTILMPLFIAFAASILIIALTLFIINSGAYIVPPSPYLEAPPGIIPVECQGDPGTPPVPSGITFGSYNGRAYAFPVAPGSSTSYPCYHWDHENAVDIWSTQTHPPIVAYVSGRIESVVLNDSLGGKYVILAGDDGQYYYYAHNCQIYVGRGQSVNAGDVLATMDNSGSARDQHLHFAINSTPTFLGGGGDVCPQTDFEEKFSIGRCTDPSKRCL